MGTLQTALLQSALTWRGQWHTYRRAATEQIEPWKSEFSDKAKAALTNAKRNLKGAKEANRG